MEYNLPRYFLTSLLSMNADIAHYLSHYNSLYSLPLRNRIRWFCRFLVTFDNVVSESSSVVPLHQQFYQLCAFQILSKDVELNVLLRQRQLHIATYVSP